MDIQSLFSLEGKNAHEIVFYYLIDIDEKDYKDTYIVSDDGGKATWVDIDDFKNGNKILYPEDIFKYL